MKLETKTGTQHCPSYEHKLKSQKSKVIVISAGLAGTHNKRHLHMLYIDIKSHEGSYWFCGRHWKSTRNYETHKRSIDGRCLPELGSHVGMSAVLKHGRWPVSSMAGVGPATAFVVGD